MTSIVSEVKQTFATGSLQSEIDDLESMPRTKFFSKNQYGNLNFDKPKRSVTARDYSPFKVPISHF